MPEESITKMAIDHGKSIATVVTAAVAASAAWMTMRFKVQSLRSHFDSFSAHNDATHRELGERLDCHKRLLMENSTATKLLRNDFTHLSDTVTEHLSDIKEQERAERLAATLKENGIKLQGPE